ncbi:hypothetical protein A6R68_15420, partial [Neotoma lepida]
MNSQGGRQEFVDAYVNYVFQVSVHEWYTAFSSGFLKVCGGKVLELFQPAELRAMMVGNSNYNWEELEETVRIATDAIFFSSVFLTGSDRIPIYGMASLQIVIQSTTTGEEYLPVAHTCYNLLDLPKYSSKEIMRARLTQALDNYEGTASIYLRANGEWIGGSEEVQLGEMAKAANGTPTHSHHVKSLKQLKCPGEKYMAQRVYEEILHHGSEARMLVFDKGPVSPKTPQYSHITNIGQ